MIVANDFKEFGMLTIFFKGYLSAAALIMAIGAQNAFVLAQGVKQQYHWHVAAVCIFFDVLFISAGMLGIGVLLEQWPEADVFFRIGGAIFLFWYGSKALRAFFSDDALSVGIANASLKGALLVALMVSTLNPHVYLDTVILLGGIGNQYTGDAKYGFWKGAVMASISLFIMLTLAAKALSPWLSQPRYWRWVEACVAIFMWSLAVWLILE